MIADEAVQRVLAVGGVVIVETGILRIGLVVDLLGVCLQVFYVVDAMSTICLIKGAEEGMKFIEEQDGVEGVFVLSNGDIQTTDGAELEAVK